jgi:TRAP-type C4-dicarboxylate transport system permease small subunit
VRFLNVFNRYFGMLVVASNALASAWIFVMMFIVVADIFMRFVFNAPIDGTTEIIQASIIAVLYLQLAFTLRSGRLTRSDAFYNRLMARRPRAGEALGLMFHAAGLAFMLAVIWPAWSRWLTAYRAGDFEGVPGVFTFPRWPAFFVLFVGCALMAIQFVLLMIDNLRGLAGKPPLDKMAAELPRSPVDGVV